MRFCLIPLLTEIRKPSKNLLHFEQRLKEVSRYQPDIVCLPECAFTGYLYDEEDFQRFTEHVPGLTTRRISALAREYGCYICYGVLESASKGVYSSAVLIDKSGEIILLHRKFVEKPPFIIGDVVKTIETDFGRVGILLCGDLFHNEVKAKIDGSANILLMLMSRSFEGSSPDLERWLNEERQVYLDEVKKVGMTTLIVNALENVSSAAAFGGAMVVNPNGELLAEAPHGTDNVLIFDMVPLDYSTI